MEFKPSEYQEDIFEFVKYGYGNAVISAVAGSGKSFTIIKALDYIKPDKRVLFLAFNSAIVESLKNKVTREKTDIKTLHSLGFSILKQNFKEKHSEIIFNEDKYRNKLNDYLIEKHGGNFKDKKYIKNVLKLCDLGRYFLIRQEIELVNIATKYGIGISDDELDSALYLIRWGKWSLEESNVIDYTDMIYLPNVLNVKVFKYDFIIIDEAQDLSVSQMSLFMKCFKQGSRFIAVGDEKQCINGFAGSDIQSFNKLKNLPNTIELPLSICYRCPKNIITYVQKLVPEIECSDNAINGFINYHAKLEDLVDGDMVICRNSLPLVKLYAKLIGDDIRCYLKGSDIGMNLLNLIQDIDKENLNDLFEEVYDILGKYIMNNLVEKNHEEDFHLTQPYNDFIDKIECLKILSEGLTTKQELVEKITNIFSDESKQGICLSTIHKSKGLEADNVYILNKHLTPSKFAKQNWEIEQEHNLEYVSFTRAKKILGFLND